MEDMQWQSQNNCKSALIFKCSVSYGIDFLKSKFPLDLIKQLSWFLRCWSLLNLRKGYCIILLYEFSLRFSCKTRI